MALDGESEAAVFRHLGEQGADVAEWMHRLKGALTTDLTGDEIAAVVVREADDGQHGGMTLARRNRARAEGVGLAVARDFTTVVALANGAQVAKAAGRDLADVQAEAEALVGKEYVEACAAAIAARAFTVDAD